MLAAVIGLLMVTAPLSWAAPGDTDSSPSETTTTAPAASKVTETVTLTDLGASPNVDFWGTESIQYVTLPVPHGLTPDTFHAVVQLPVNIRAGTLIVTQEERLLAKLALPTTDQTPIVVPLAGAEVVGDAVTLTMRATIVPLEGNCLYPWSPLRLISGTVSYSGVAQPPITVAQFLPPILRKLTIYLPNSPSEAESDAAVRLAALTTARYGSQKPEVSVAALPEGQSTPPVPAQGLERQIVIKEGGDDALSIEGGPGPTWLLISGPLGRVNEADMGLLFGPLSPLAVASKVSVGSLTASHQFPGDTVTLRDLGRPFVSAEGLRPRVSIGIDQTRYGRSIHAVRVHVVGSYSPTPANVGGQIEVMIGNETIERWPTDNTGSIDRWVTVPDRLLERFTSLDLVLEVASNTDRCGGFYNFSPGNQALKLTVNGDTTISSSPASPPVPDGLRSVPQALMPRMQVGIGQRSLSDTVRAVQLIVLMQRVSAVPIETTVTSVDKALGSSDPALVIAADGWNHKDIELPVSAGATGPVTVNVTGSDGKPTTFTLDPTVRFASLQAIVNRGRTVLVATSNGTSLQLDALLGWLNTEESPWGKLNGVALVLIPGQDPVAVEHPPAPLGSGSMQSGRAGPGWLTWFGAGWIGVAVIGIGVIVYTNRRRLFRR